MERIRFAIKKEKTMKIIFLIAKKPCPKLVPGLKICKKYNKQKMMKYLKILLLLKLKVIVL